MTTQVDAVLAELAQATVLPEIALGLERVEACLERLGHPERKLPPVVHIAGTNGKGSTIATLRAMAETAGKRVHVYTSPHLVRFHERIVLAGEMIDDARLLDTLARVKEAAGEDIPLTFFEATTLAAFLAFSEVEADLLLLEVGLGGRLDATNVVSPVMCLVTPISEDHKEYLGDTLAAIAAEKVGIIKPGAQVVVAGQPVEVMEVVETAITRAQAAAWVYGVDWEIMDGAGLSVRVREARYALPRPKLAGVHQRMNTACAFVAGLALGLEADDCVKGILKVQWPGRLQRLMAGPLVASLEEGGELWLDGGHNPAAGEALAEWAAAQEVPVGLMVGMLRRKDAEGFFRACAGMDVAIATLSMVEDNGFDASELAAMAIQAGCGRVRPVEAEKEGLVWLQENGVRRAVICGSLYLAGKVLRNHS